MTEQTDINQELTDFIIFLIESTSIFQVDDDGYIIDRDTEERTIIEIDDKEKYLRVLSIPFEDRSDTIVLNPFHETIRKSPDQRWFYGVLAISISTKLSGMFKSIIDYHDIQESLSVEQLNELSPYLDKIDKKTSAEINRMSKGLLDLSNIVYNQKLKQAYFRSGIFETGFRKKFKTVRNKTWLYIENYFCDIFKIDQKLELEEKRVSLKDKYKSKTLKITCPMFICFMDTYYKLLTQMNEKLEYLGQEDYIVDLTVLSHYMKNINTYYNKTKWLTNNTGESISETEAKDSIIPEGYRDPTQLNAVFPGMAGAVQGNVPGLQPGLAGVFPGMMHQVQQPVQQPSFQQPQQPLGGFPGMMPQVQQPLFQQPQQPTSLFGGMPSLIQ